jgi:hypothetical protein
MSTGEIIALVCVVSLLPLWAAGSIIRFALGTCSCGVALDPYRGEGDGGSRRRDRCPANPRGPDGRGGDGPQDPEGQDEKEDWWPQFERDLGRYVEEQRPCPWAPMRR